MSANKPIRVPADYKGLKMRIQSSKVLGDEMKALGAIPQVMAFSEVYQALQTGVVDGTENPPSNFYTQKMQEVQKYLALTDHGYLGYALIANKKFWDGLPADIRTALEGAVKDTTAYANNIAQKENDDAIEAVRKSGKTEIIALTPDQKAAMKKALVGVHKDNESRVGKETLAEVYKDRFQAVLAAAPVSVGGRRRSEREVPGSSRGVDHHVPDGRGHAAHLRGGAPPLLCRAADSRLQDALLKIDLSWAQELCIYMFVWMASSALLRRHAPASASAST
jgi:hypothetical protein